MPSPNTPQATDEPTEDGGGAGADPDPEPVIYSHKSEVINGLKQEIHILEIDPGAAGVKIKPVLSHDLIYGFETLSTMAERKNAHAAVNGGFFREYGLPSGMVVIDGELIAASTGKYPVFVVEDGTASLKEINSEMTVEYSGTGGSGSIPADVLNLPAGGKATAVYTPVYGKYNRADKKNITATVENGVVSKIADCIGESEIPPNGMLITFFDTAKYEGIELPFKIGDTVTFTHRPKIGAGANAYECGSWLVRNGEPTAPLKDAWVGVLTNHDPRTAVGIKEDGTVILLVVDGRQPDYSYGFTGNELADYLIRCGARDAAMLDGGASTEMIVAGQLVSRPSFKGEERPLAGGLLVLLEE